MGTLLKDLRYAARMLWKNPGFTAVAVLVVTPNLFRVLGASAERGRLFSDEEVREDASHVALVKHSLWQRRFGSDPELVGKTLRLDDKTYTVVGVMPDDFDFPLNSSEIWVPLAFDQKDEKNRGNHSFQVVGLLRPGVSIAQADSAVHAAAERARQL